MPHIALAHGEVKQLEGIGKELLLCTLLWHGENHAIWAGEVMVRCQNGLKTCIPHIVRDWWGASQGKNVWCEVTCGQGGHHGDGQMGPCSMVNLVEFSTRDFLWHSQKKCHMSRSKKVSGIQQITTVIVHYDVKTDDQHVEMHMVPWWCHIMVEGLTFLLLLKELGMLMPLKLWSRICSFWLVCLTVHSMASSHQPFWLTGTGQCGWWWPSCSSDISGVNYYKWCYLWGMGTFWSVKGRPWGWRTPYAVEAIKVFPLDVLPTNL